MYRQYENPYKLEAELARYEDAYSQCTDEDERFELAQTISELKDRINFAWQDEEYDENY